MTAASVVEQRLWQALSEIEDPELPVSLVDLGLIVDLKYHAAERSALVKLTFTAMGCPAMAMIKDDVRERLLQEPEVDSVVMDVVWKPAWTSVRITPLGKEELRRVGVAV